MLEQMHKHMKWIMWTIVALVTVTFLFFGIYPSTTSGRTAAKVDGYVITTDEVNRAYLNMAERYRAILKDQFNQNFADVLRKQALQQLIQDRLLVQEARRKGMKVSDEELRAFILQIAGGLNNQGRFDQLAYERALQNNNMTPAVFEASQREYLLRQKLVRLIEDQVAVSDAELPAAYAARNPKAKKGEFEKSKDSFKQSLLAEKQRDALDAYVRVLMSKSKIQINQGAQGLAG